MASQLRNLLRNKTLQNTGSTARDHLASERTFLAWLRTGLGFVALGIAVERFSQFELELNSQPSSLLQNIVADAKRTGSPAAATQSQSQSQLQESSTARVKRSQEHAQREQILVAALLGVGVGSIVYGGARYFSNLRLLEQGLFRPAYKGAAGIGIGVAGLAGVAWWGMVRTEQEKNTHQERTG